MTYWEPSSPPSPQHSPELERRLTRLEISSEGHTAKLSLHEKAILVLAGSLYILAQDRFPQIASIIRGLLIP